MYALCPAHAVYERSFGRLNITVKREPKPEYFTRLYASLSMDACHHPVIVHKLALSSILNYGCLYKTWISDALNPLFTTFSSRFPLLSLLSHIYSTPVLAKQLVMVLKFGPERTKNNPVVPLAFGARWLIDRPGQDLIDHLPMMPKFADELVARDCPGEPSVMQQMAVVKKGQAIFPEDLLKPKHEKGLVPGFPAFKNIYNVRESEAFKFRPAFNFIKFPRFGVYNTGAVFAMCEVGCLDLVQGAYLFRKSML